MKSFETESELLEYGKTLGKRDMEKVLLNEKTVMLCGTNLSYEDALWATAEEALEKTVNLFGFNGKIETDFVAEIRDILLKSVGSQFDFEVINATEEYKTGHV